VHPTVRKAIFPVAILAGIGMFGLAGFFGRTDDGTPRAQEGLESVQPVSRAEAQARQVTIIADLAPGYAGILKINDVTIPPGQLEQDDGLNKLMFRPGEGKVLTQLNPRENCAEVTYWERSQGSATARPPYRWCFNVL